MFRIFTVITFAFTLLGPLFVLRCNCAAVSQNPVSSQAKGDDGLTSGSKAKDVLSVVDKGRGRGKSTGKDVLSATRKGKGKGKGEDWAEIIGGLTVVQSEPLPSLYTFIINEYSGNGDEDDEDDDDGFVRQSACFQEAKKTGSLTAYRTPCIDTTEEFGRLSGDMSFSKFRAFQNRVRGMLWQEENRRELLGGAVMFEATMAPLKRTMYLTYPEANEGIDLMVVVESNGVNSKPIRIRSDQSNRKIERNVPRQQLFIRDYRQDGQGFQIEPYIPF